MKFTGTGKITRDSQGNVTERILLAEMTETEAMMITGVHGRPVIAGRFKPGRSVNIGKIYNKVKQIVEKFAEIRAAMIEIRSKTEEIDTSLPLTQEP